MRCHHALGGFPVIQWHWSHTRSCKGCLQTHHFTKLDLGGISLVCCQCPIWGKEMFVPISPGKVTQQSEIPPFRIMCANSPRLVIFKNVVEPLGGWASLKEVGQCQGGCWGSTARSHFLFLLCFLTADVIWSGSSCFCHHASPRWNTAFLIYKPKEALPHVSVFLQVLSYSNEKSGKHGPSSLTSLHSEIKLWAMNCYTICVPKALWLFKLWRT